MNRYIPVLLALAASALQAQTAAPTPLAADLKNQYTAVKNLITAAAAKMPDDGYAFQPTAPERNFGGWVAHVADSEMRICSTISGAVKSIDAASKTTKADLVAALKQGFDACDAVYDSTTDANLNDATSMGRGGPRTRAALLVADIAHSNECYGTMAVYLRLKELVPPSSEGRGGRGGRGGPGPGPGR
jgi:uncharacterized damage-inducible protein DinB